MRMSTGTPRPASLPAFLWRRLFLRMLLLWAGVRLVLLVLLLLAKVDVLGPGMLAANAVTAAVVVGVMGVVGAVDQRRRNRGVLFANAGVDGRPVVLLPLVPVAVLEAGLVWVLSR